MDKNRGPDPIRSDTQPSGDGDQADAALSVVGIGASAGGLEAFRLLLGGLPADTGLAIVLVQHLDPTHQSSLSEILGRATRMPVGEALDGVRVERNHVYVIPPNAELTIVNRVLKLSPRDQSAAPHMPIDLFLRSLAQDCGGSAIGVILSGAGSDGALGLQAIKEAGGVTFVQQAATANFPSMPQMAEAATGVDFVLPPAEIAAELARIAHHPNFAVAQAPEQEPSPKEGIAGLHDILTIMHEATGIDFSLYRKKTVERRIMRRLALRNIANIEEYAAQLRKDRGERGLLERDLLISVTSFFREPGSFQALTKVVFPALVQNRSEGAVIRIWVPGCASGEEAYSIAISLQEYLKETGAAFPIKIFASDVSQTAIEKARSGKYPESIAADVSAERLKRHFAKIEGGYQVGKALRDLCVFSRHNLIDDPPFAKLDLISCRNVLIYLGAVRKTIIPLFHYALNANGFLMLGQSETADFDELFSIADRDHKIFARRESARRPQPFRARTNALRPGAEAREVIPPAPLAELWDGIDIRKAVDSIVLSRYSPAAVLVDESLDVLEIRGDATPFFKLPVGKLSFHLLKLIPDTGLFLEIEKLVHEVAGTGAVARRTGVPYERDGAIREVNIEVAPLHGQQRQALLIFLEPTQNVEQLAASAEQTPGRGELIARRDKQIAKLRQESVEARRRLLSVIEEQQVSDEESQSATEEALSTNEELQSLNEELETAKEELQSTNEELITVNQELESKSVALIASLNFALSIVRTVPAPLLVLDKEMRIRTVNDAFSETFQIPLPDAEGQLIFSLAESRWDIPGLRTLLDRVIPADEPFDNLEVELKLASGTRCLIVNARRLHHLDLILVAIDDCTVRKEAEKALQQSQDALRQAQKMEAIGRLAGGIAHDFNNLLTVIIGYTHLVAVAVGPGHKTIQYVREIENAGHRAAALTDQLLAFSRRKVLQPKVFDVNSVVADFERMLRRIVGEQIKVVVRLASDLRQVRADPGEIGRALMNLCLNARDAMPTGGTLTIQTGNVEVDEAAAHLHKLAAGQYIELIVGDTGIGMDTEVQGHVFEPFFTTKETGKGTGLGLATVLGIVEQSDGSISCHSELGQGTTFKILLPAIAAQSEAGEQSTGGLAEAPKGAAEVVLLVEDEVQVRKLASTILTDSGYLVLEAGNGREGVTVCEAHQGKIDLLLSDVVMPEIGGRELAERVLKIRPGIKVLFMSGHTQDVMLKEGVQAGTPFLQKPFSPAALARKVREVLDSQGPPARTLNT